MLSRECDRLDAAHRRMAGIEGDEHQLRVGHLQNHVDFGLALDDRPGVRMERELHAVLERALADFVEVLARILAFAGLRSPGRAAAEVRLQCRDAEKRAELRIGGVAVERRLELGRVEVFATAGDR